MKQINNSSKEPTNSICIVGSGRFASVLVRLLGDNFKITIPSRSKSNQKGFEESTNLKLTTNIKSAYDTNTTIIYSVPISKFAEVIENHSEHITSAHLLIDVLSVKLHAEKVLREITERTGARAILTHPMFGPDSSKNGFESLPFIIHNLNATPREFDFWCEFLQTKKLEVINMSPKEHDKQAAYSQGVAHYLGRALQRFDYKKTNIDSLGAKKLYEIMEQTCNDTLELFYDLQNYNPYTKKMREKLKKSLEETL